MMLWKGALAISARMATTVAIMANTFNNHHHNNVLHLLEGPDQFYN
jgi:hypothetical protein